jgi:hypothetical protein
MRNRILWIIVGLLIASLALSACGGGASATAATHEKSYSLEPIDGSEFQKVTFTEKAAQRLVLEKGKVAEEQIAGANRLVVPYSSLIYGKHGETWVYVNLEAFSFQRAVVDVDYIEGDQVVLKAGPAVGTEIATTAVAELYGVDTGVKK